MEELLREISRFIVENFSFISQWVLKLIENIVGRPMPTYPTIPTIMEYLRSVNTSTLEYIGKILGV